MNPLRPLARVFSGSAYAVLGFAAAREPGQRVTQAGPLLAKLRANNIPLPNDEVTVRLNGATQAVAGAALAIGFYPRTAALVISGSMLPTTLAGHAYWAVEDPQARQMQQVQFYKNLAMIGGLLFAAMDKCK